MRFLELQILTTFIFFVAELHIIFKKKQGWAYRQIGLAFIIVLNYLAGLFLLIIPTVISMILGTFAYYKWKKDDKKKKQQGLIKGMVLFAKATELCVIHGLVLATPAKEVKRMKLRQIEKDLEALQIKKVKK